MYQNIHITSKVKSVLKGEDLLCCYSSGSIFSGVPPHFPSGLIYWAKAAIAALPGATTHQHQLVGVRPTETRGRWGPGGKIWSGKLSGTDSPCDVCIHTNYTTQLGHVKTKWPEIGLLHIFTNKKCVQRFLGYDRQWFMFISNRHIWA